MTETDDTCWECGEHEPQAAVTHCRRCGQAVCGDHLWECAKCCLGFCSSCACCQCCGCGFCVRCRPKKCEDCPDYDPDLDCPAKPTQYDAWEAMTTSVQRASRLTYLLGIVTDVWQFYASGRPQT